MITKLKVKIILILTSLGGWSLTQPRRAYQGVSMVANQGKKALIMETFFETLFSEIIMGSLEYIGGFIKWIFYWGRKPYKEVVKEKYTKHLGFLFLSLLVISILLI